MLDLGNQPVRLGPRRRQRLVLHDVLAEPRGPHAVNLILHVLNVALLFGVLRSLTGDPLPSLAVAAFFALHPANVESVTVTDLADGTFYATLDLRTAGGEPLHVDARPSDAIALGIGLSVPIFVEEHVLEGAQDGDPG